MRRDRGPCDWQEEAAQPKCSRRPYRESPVEKPLGLRATSCLSRPATAASRRAMRLGAEGAAMLAHSGVVTAVSRRAMRLGRGRPRAGLGAGAGAEGVDGGHPHQEALGVEGGDAETADDLGRDSAGQEHVGRSPRRHRAGGDTLSETWMKKTLASPAVSLLQSRRAGPRRPVGPGRWRRRACRCCNSSGCRRWRWSRSLVRLSLSPRPRRRRRSGSSTERRPGRPGWRRPAGACSERVVSDGIWVRAITVVSIGNIIATPIAVPEPCSPRPGPGRAAAGPKRAAAGGPQPEPPHRRASLLGAEVAMSSRGPQARALISTPPKAGEMVPPNTRARTWPRSSSAATAGGRVSTTEPAAAAKAS